MELVNAIVEQYAYDYTSDDDNLLVEIDIQTKKTHPKHHMLSGKVQGRFLQMISKLCSPKLILEIGTYTGYSALCLAAGLQPNGELHTIECRTEDANTAQLFFNKSKFSKQIKLHIGNAIEIITTLNMQWDIVFIDADKVQYSAYYDLILPNVKSGGLIIVDNIFFHGDVLQQPPKGKNAIALTEFNKKIKNDESVEKVLLTIRDGLFLIRKK